jgi:hypothetical protein
MDGFFVLLKPGRVSASKITSILPAARFIGGPEKGLTCYRDTTTGCQITIHLRRGYGGQGKTD